MKTFVKFVILQRNLISLQSVRFYRNEGAHKLIDGKSMANEFLLQLKIEITKWVNRGNRAPHLSVIMVEGNSSNDSYVKMKCKAAELVGITSDVQILPKTTSQSDLLKKLEYLNESSKVDGVLVQLPLSNHMDLKQVCDTIYPAKDVDGFTPYSLGKLCLNEPHFIPCTALAVHHIVCSLGIEMTGKRAVICGRSRHVGLPIALVLHSSLKLGEFKGLNMSTTICHRHTPLTDVTSFARNADLLISAVGQPNFIRENMIKPGAVVIDVGFTEILQGDKRRVVGDVNTTEVQKVAGMLSPVPGGVGPVTVAMLMSNTFVAAKYLAKNI